MAAAGLSLPDPWFGRLADDERLRAGALTLLPVVLTVGTVLPFVAFGGLDPGYAVLAAAVSLSSARFDRHSAPGGRGRLLRIPVIVVVIALIGFLLERSWPLGDAAVVATYGWGLLSRRFGGLLAAAGRAILLPLVAMFMTPVPVGGNPVLTVLLVVLVCLAAAIWALGLDRILGRGAPSSGRLRRAASRARPRADDVRPAAVSLDARLAPGAPARADVVRVQVAVDAGDDPSESLAALDVSLRDPGPATAEGTQGALRQDVPRRRPSAGAVTRLAAQGTLSLALGLVAGQLLFPAHWTWTAVTVLTLTVGARARGDVLVRGLERLGGAAAGAVLSAVVVELVRGHRAVAVAVLLVVLALGVVLRDVGYVWWALCLTTVLGLLYSTLGQASGFSVLGERLLAVLVGAVCAVLPSFFLRPIRSRALARRRAADWLAAVRSLLDPESVEPVVTRLRAVEYAAVHLVDVVPPLRLAARVLRRPSVELDWAAGASGSLPVSRRVALGDPAAAGELRRAYGRVGRSVRDVTTR